MRRADDEEVSEVHAPPGARRPRRLLRGRALLLAVAVLAGCSALAGAAPVEAPFAATTSSGVAVTATSSFYRDAVLQDGPVGYWRLSDSSGPAVDVAAGRSGTYENGTQRGVPGRSADGDTAAGFDGINDSVRVNHQYGFTGRQAFSTELLYHATSHAGSAARFLLAQYLFETPPAGESLKGWLVFTYPVGGDWKFYVGRCSGVEADGLCDYASSATTLETGTWYHLAATYDGTTMRVYVDGALDGQATSTRSLPVITDPFRIGWDGTYYPTHTGTLDEVALFDHALPPARIQAHAARAG